MKINKYQFLVLDIDGTLLNSQNELTDATFRRLMQLTEDGYHLVLASGRPTVSMIETAKTLGLDKTDSYIISYNGAEITSMKTLEPIYRQCLDENEQQAIVDFNQAQGLSTISYQGDRITVDYPNEHSEVETFLTKIPMTYDPDFFKPIKGQQLKFIGVGPVEKVAAADGILQGKFQNMTNATTSLPYFLEYFHREVSKGNAINALVERLGYKLSDVVACGDGNNDASMIKAAGLGIAMGNATDYLKSLAQEVTLTNDEDGLIPVMDKYFPRT